MNNQNPLKVYTTAQLIEKVEKESRERLLNGLKDGDFRVYFRRSDLTLQIERNGQDWYEIDLERCNSSSELLNLIFDIHGKNWGCSGGVLAAVLTMLDDACYQIFGKSTQTLANSGKILNWKNPQL